jgi:sn-glycerol 3-phosphate transport system ATP-binding protein
MGRAIVRKPQVFLFDEPLSNLDAKLRVQMRVEIKRLQRGLGVTSIYVTHDQVEAMTMADQLVVMNAGRIEQIGTPTEVYRRPATRYVATFIGSPPMNILPARLEGAGAVSIAGVRIPVADMPEGLGAGTTVEAGLRPEDLQVTDGPEGLPFAVDFVEELGATQLFHGRAGEAELVVQAPTGRVAPDGRPLRLLIDASAVHLFDPATGERLGRGAVGLAA